MSSRHPGEGTFRRGADIFAPLHDAMRDRAVAAKMSLHIDGVQWRRLVDAGLLYPWQSSKETP